MHETHRGKYRCKPLKVYKSVFVSAHIIIGDGRPCCEIRAHHEQFLKSSMKCRSTFCEILFSEDQSYFDAQISGCEDECMLLKKQHRTVSPADNNLIFCSSALWNAIVSTFFNFVPSASNQPILTFFFSPIDSRTVPLKHLNPHEAAVESFILNQPVFIIDVRPTLWRLRAEIRWICKPESHLIPQIEQENIWWIL